MLFRSPFETPAAFGGGVTAHVAAGCDRTARLNVRNSCFIGYSSAFKTLPPGILSRASSEKTILAKLPGGQKRLAVRRKVLV